MTHCADIEESQPRIRPPFTVLILAKLESDGKKFPSVDKLGGNLSKTFLSLQLQRKKKTITIKAVITQEIIITKKACVTRTDLVLVFVLAA